MPQEKFINNHEPYHPYMADFAIIYVPQNAALDYPSFDKWLLAISTSDPWSPDKLVALIHQHIINLIKPQELSVSATITTTAHAPLRITIP